MSKMSFVVLSYNRPIETVEVIQNIIYDLQDVEGIEKEVIVINNGSSVSYTEVTNFIQENNLDLKYIDHPENLGVSGGRNLGVQHATGEYLIFIDDDAVFKETDIIEKIASKFAQYESLGIIGFGIYNFYTNEIDHPVKKKAKLKEIEFYNNIFWGGAFVVLKKVLDEVGSFDDRFFYGMEEYDLAYRAINHKYKILFTSEISILHKVSPSGREKNSIKYYRMFVNKCLIAYRYLPLHYVFSHIFMWSGFLLLKSRGNILLFFKAIQSLTKEIRKGKRTTISKDAIQYIKSVSGRLTY